MGGKDITTQRKVETKQRSFYSTVSEKYQPFNVERPLDFPLPRFVHVYRPNN